MTTVFLAPDPIQSTQFIPGGNTPAAGAQLFCYVFNSSTKQNMYTSNAGSSTWSNPLVLDSGGNIPNGGEIWIPQSLPAKFVLAPSNDTDPPNSPYWTKDNISGVNDVVTTASGEWVLFTDTPTFTGATTFTVTGDQTAIFSAGRRVKTTNTGGTIYSTISTSVFGVLTTVTVINDSGSLDSGLTTVSYSNLSTPNGSVPWLEATTTGQNLHGRLSLTGALTLSASSAVVPINGLYLPASNNPALSANSTKVISWTSTGTVFTGTLTGTSSNLLSPITNSISSNVSLVSTLVYFDGPSVAQGSSGTWFASGHVTVQLVSAGNEIIAAKLWDGTTLMASAAQLVPTAAGGNVRELALSGYIVNPVGNIKISVTNASATTSALMSTYSNAKDCTITAFRIA